MKKQEKKIPLRRQNLEKIIEIVNKEGRMPVKDAMRLIMNSEWISSNAAKNRLRDIILMQKVDIAEYSPISKEWSYTNQYSSYFEDYTLIKHKVPTNKKES